MTKKFRMISMRCHSICLPLKISGTMQEAGVYRGFGLFIAPLLWIGPSDVLPKDVPRKEQHLGIYVVSLQESILYRSQ